VQIWGDIIILQRQKERSLGEIAKEVNCTRQYIYKMMKQYDIPLRSSREAHTIAREKGKIIYKRFMVDGSEVEVTTQKVTVNEFFFSS